MSGYAKYETEAGQASESATYGVMLEHLRLAAENAYTLGHLRKANGDELIGTGFIGIGQLLEKVCTLVTKLAMRGSLQ
jgi:hypothetical protein